MPGGFGQFAGQPRGIITELFGNSLLYLIPRGQGLGRNDRIGLLLLAVVGAAAWFVVAAGQMRGFHERPGQILVAAFSVVLALLLAIALAETFHAAAVAGEVPGVGEALGIAGFQGDGQAENLADARQFQQALDRRAISRRRSGSAVPAS